MELYNNINESCREVPTIINNLIYQLRIIHEPYNGKDN